MIGSCPVTNTYTRFICRDRPACFDSSLENHKTRLPARMERGPGRTPSSTRTFSPEQFLIAPRPRGRAVSFFQARPSSIRTR